MSKLASELREGAQVKASLWHLELASALVDEPLAQLLGAQDLQRHPERFVECLRAREALERLVGIAEHARE